MGKALSRPLLVPQPPLVSCWDAEARIHVWSSLCVQWSSWQVLLGSSLAFSALHRGLGVPVETTLANDSQRAAMAVFISVSRSALPKVAELTTLAADAFDESLEAAMKAAQFLDHAGCASLQFAHFAFSLLLL